MAGALSLNIMENHEVLSDFCSRGLNRKLSSIVRGGFGFFRSVSSGNAFLLSCFPSNQMQFTMPSPTDATVISGPQDLRLTISPGLNLMAWFRNVLPAILQPRLHSRPRPREPSTAKPIPEYRNQVNDGATPDSRAAGIGGRGLTSVYCYKRSQFDPVIAAGPHRA